MQNSLDSIVAIATAPGRGGVGIVRISGPDISAFTAAITGKKLLPRQATFTDFSGANGEVLDEGVAIYFPAPASFTGEHVLELQGHGGPVILDALVQRCVELGARPARPGEFSERAFLNDKLDLAQAEAIADLIDATSIQAARCAVRSLQGDFSRLVNELVNRLISIRLYVEAAIDFPEEEIDFLADERLTQNLQQLSDDLRDTLSKAQQGSLLRDGMTVVLAGKPNAGKSSLLNALAGRDAAIVTPKAGTTRDVLRETVTLDGMPLHIVDTAGLRDSDDEIELEGIRRAWLEIEQADQLLFLVDANESDDPDLAAIWPEYFARFGVARQPISVVLNKIDESGHRPGRLSERVNSFAISAKHKTGLDELVDFLQSSMGFDERSEGLFSARRRHLAALEKALELVVVGQRQLSGSGAGELLAEDLRLAQTQLSEITGVFTSDDLLGHIFSSFCIGK
ncbi:tRNA uridine-5-carboxymethylaminomethyl(34) synthesis GTPase MnmE [Porticoccaceae bacterium]|nr:tRNA uridine-5-carboxymethylaminomethyl(34) synthesis GTPase MnmE [Porticoccaceae bacterium]MDB9736778.1 tRNA uridine-5-carboxymethylaminomethyl(34) synthesis GTPase MnmE [Porticoccaceae bacterium]MDB9804510.1 tRNA uridine-5-carboxymethylaminomethyl(34) synthesis GTPase MnmE [Porticoccaceae bacterium]